MRKSIIVAGLLAALLLAACGGSAEPTPVAQETVEPTEEALRQRAEAATTAWNEGKWLDFYAFKSPRSVAPRFPYGLPAVQMCTREQFVLDTGTKMAKLRASVGMGEDEPLSWRITAVSINDVKTRGYFKGRVYLEILYDGEPIESERNDYFGVSDEGAQWVFIDGEWWLEDENWRDGCHTTKLFG